MVDGWWLVVGGCTRRAMARLVHWLVVSPAPQKGGSRHVDALIGLR
ncbi:hypothetical protein [Fischerella sp. FACHB-380]|nr:hypothetical protein [Fischerella sp. FACHB-380]